MAKAKKGSVGKNTGGATRRAIRAAQSRGCSLEQIGRATSRDGSTISAIKTGTIRNPPAGLAGRISKSCKGRKKR